MTTTPVPHHSKGVHGERFVKEVGLESGVKERVRELWMVITSIVERRYDGVGMLLAAGEWT